MAVKYEFQINNNLKICLTQYLTYTGNSSFICNVIECSAFLFANSGNPVSEWQLDCSKAGSLVISFPFLIKLWRGYGDRKWGINVPFPLYLGGVSVAVKDLKRKKPQMSQIRNIRFLKLTVYFNFYIGKLHEFSQASLYQEFFMPFSSNKAKKCIPCFNLRRIIL